MACNPGHINSSFIVSVAPDRLEIRGPETCKVGQSLNFQCSASNSNPASSLSWEVDGDLVSSSNNVTQVSREGGWMTSSNISINIGASDKTKTISCFAKNAALGETKVETHIVTVLCKYPIVRDDL